MQKYSRHGQLIDSVQCTSVFVYANRESTTDYSTQAFTLIEFRQCKRKGNSMKMQPRKLKIMLLKALWDFVKVWGPRGSIPCFPSPPPTSLSGPAHTHTFEMLQPIYSPHTAHSVFKLQ